MIGDAWVGLSVEWHGLTTAMLVLILLNYQVKCLFHIIKPCSP
jgi:hypothetical protein